MFERRIAVNDAGRKLYLATLHQYWTHETWFEGAASLRRTEGSVDHALRTAKALQKAMNTLVTVPHLLLLEPAVRALNPVGGEVAILPEVTCIAELESTDPTAGATESYSKLLLVWHQPELAMPIIDEALAAMMRLDWDSLAEDFNP